MLCLSIADGFVPVLHHLEVQFFGIHMTCFVAVRHVPASDVSANIKPMAVQPERAPKQTYFCNFKTIEATTIKASIKM